MQEPWVRRVLWINARAGNCDFFLYPLTTPCKAPFPTKGGDTASLRSLQKNETYSFASSMLLFQYSSLLVPPPHIIKHIIITWLSACASLRSILALPGNQFVVTLCNPSKVIKWNELQLQRAFKNTGGKKKGKRNARKMTTQPRNIPPLDSTSQVLKMKY